MSLLIKWWKHNPEYIATILIGLVAFSTFWHIAGKSNDGEPCPAVNDWTAEVADQRKFLRMNRPDRREAMREWELEHSHLTGNSSEERLLEVSDAGWAAVELQDCGGLDERGLLSLDAPTTEPLDVQRECFEHYTERRGSYRQVVPAVKPGCHDILADSAAWITQNFPES
ncbi:hypothetical protein [Candidatus Poriferisocius sp.]|uniref:hypothetical protein n=1 Tax=Candidatus Poriferisocius sp. TaxID=3101276 RepID=UPI003B01F287